MKRRSKARRVPAVVKPPAAANRIEKSWGRRLTHLLLRLSREFRAEPGTHLANEDTVRRTLRGIGPDNPTLQPECGAYMVVNLASVHVPAFCRDGYKNAYDLEAEARTAGPPRPTASRVSARRARVDQALPLAPGVTPEQVYFGAVDLTGAGMRYYGDVCLVLKPQAIEPATVVLDRNSFDVDRSPAVDRINGLPHAQQHPARAATLSSWAGRWERDLAAMATLRMHALGASWSRRWTTGQVARMLVDDEDYLEVLRHGSFNATEVQEARLFATDVGLEARIASRAGTGPTPRLEDLIWQRQRLQAEAALIAAGIPVRVVTHSGRARS